MQKTAYRSALVLGLGASGEAAAELLLREGCAVAVFDRSGSDALEGRARGLRAAGAAVELGVTDLSRALSRGGVGGAAFDVCIMSPGIAADDPWVDPVRVRGIGLLSELELGATRCKARLIAVTGSNGKSTCTKLCGSILERNGWRVALGGNYGTPLSAIALAARPLDWIVVEVSSFQLETVRDFAPEVAVLLNLQPDHLDRHRTMDRYIRLKASIFDRLGPANPGVILDQALDSVRSRTQGCPRWVSFGTELDTDYRYEQGEVLFREAGAAKTLSLRGTLFENEVMGLTAAAALAVARLVRVSPAAFEAAVRDYEPLPHRLQVVGAKNGIRFMDDSKATNLGAMCGALRMVRRPVRLIAGGLLKEGGLENVKEMLANTVKRVYLIGQSAMEMEKAWGGTVDCVLCADLEKATRMAWRDAQAGEVVLLSPGCASFDQFKSYSDRGEQFSLIAERVMDGKDGGDED